MEISKEVALVQLCKKFPSLTHHPLLAPAIINWDGEAILEHLRQQRTWLGNLSTDVRARLDIRNSVELLHAKAASVTLAAFEQLTRTA